MYRAEVIEDSVNKFGRRATTIAVTYPRIILAELNTHRMFSRNTSSSRAIPMIKMIEQVWNRPFMPIYWGKNKAGMQASEELTGWQLWAAKKTWLAASKIACGMALLLHWIGAHKQIGNRILEPWMWTHTIITATEWDNFFALRNHHMAQPEIKRLAEVMADAFDASIPHFIDHGEWHLPYVTEKEKATYTLEECIKFSAARCARVSFLTHDNKLPNVEKDIALHDDLVVAEPKHASPSEHQLTAAHLDNFYFNLRSFTSYRFYIETGKTPYRKRSK